MESIFQPKKGSTNPSKQSSLLATDVFRRIEPGNPLNNAPEEMKRQETIVFQGVAEEVHHHRNYHHRSNDHEMNGANNAYDQQAAAQQHQQANNGQDNNQSNADGAQSLISIELTTCFQLAYSPENKLGTACPSINEFLRGGLLPKRLYEIYGEAGTGKTNFAIQLLLNSILPEVQTGLNGSALFVTAGRQLNEKRFNEMKDNFLAESAKIAQYKQQAASVTENDVRTRIHLQHVNSIDEYTKLFINLAARVDEQTIKLVIIDNIHAVCENFIKQDGTVDYIERAQFMYRHSKQLKRLAWDFKLVVVILNNVVADVNHDGANKGFFENRSRGQHIVPSLGLNWANCINERIALKKKAGTSNVEVKRTIAIEKSSYMRRNDLEFEIVAQGLRGKH